MTPEGARRGKVNKKIFSDQIFEIQRFSWVMSSGVPSKLVNHQCKGTLPGVNPENQAKNDGKSKNLDFSKNALKASADVGAMFGFGNSISDGNKIEISSKS